MSEVRELLALGLLALVTVPAASALLALARAAASAASRGYVSGQDVNALAMSLFAMLFAVSMYRIALATIG